MRLKTINLYYSKLLKFYCLTLILNLFIFTAIARASSTALENEMNKLVIKNCKDAGFKNYSDFIYSMNVPQINTCINEVEKGLEKLKEDPPGKSIAEKYDNGVALAYYYAELNEKIYKIHLIEIHSQF